MLTATLAVTAIVALAIARFLAHRTPGGTLASIVMCDRCKALGMATALGGMIFQAQLRRQERGRKKYELCPACVGDVEAFLAAPPDRTTNEKPFTEPYDDGYDDDAPQALTATASVTRSYDYS